jgi:CheY-like chemotaxis protein
MSSGTQLEREDERAPAATGLGALSSKRPVEALWSIDVLVVDDDAADTSLIMEILRDHHRVGVAIASDEPEAALFQLAQGWARPGLILLDIHMPRVNGFVFLEALREIPRFKDTPVVFLTTSGHTRDVENARKTSATSYVVKPDTYDGLRERINAVIKQALTKGGRKK